MNDVTEDGLLGPDGPFAATVPGFVARPLQQQMAARITQAIREREILVAESPTGTGKTWSYLVPALLSGDKVIISTGTRHLQDQVFRRDLPQVVAALRSGPDAALNTPLKSAVLKGRANYLCHYRLRHYAGEQRELLREHALDLEEVRRWADASPDGDLGELQLPESPQLRHLLSSTADNCLGGKCPELEKCRVRRARNEARQADVVIVNHHLFFSDLVLKDDGFGELLPDAGTVIFDEAHQLPRTALAFLDARFSTAQVRELCRDVEHAMQAIFVIAGKTFLNIPLQSFTPLATAITESARTLGKAAQRFGKLLQGDTQRRLLSEARGAGGFDEAHSALHEALEGLAGALAEAPPPERAALAGGTSETEVEAMYERFEELPQLRRRAAVLAEALAEVLDEQARDDRVRWVESGARGFTLHATPLSPGQGLSGYLNSGERTFVFTSATLAAGDSFEHFTTAMGIPQAATVQWPTPFDYQNQALLYVPQELPDPRDASYLARMMPVALDVIAAAGGRTFLLFTSHRALAEAREIIVAASLPYPLLVQEDMPRHRLLERFREHGNAVLLGTASFWEGVDVRGDALSCVIIDKLPFRSPDDPVLQERLRRIEEEGRNGFMEVMVPEAVVALKQGAGRLIRDHDDTGVLVICDPRLLGKGYGRRFLQSLPPLPLCRDLDTVRAFFNGAGAPRGTGR